VPSVLVTGANRGLGLEFARQYAEDGWRVFAACRSPNQAAELARLCDGHPAASVHAVDVAEPASIDRLAGELSEEPIDLLLNNAGVIGKNQHFGSLERDGWLAALATNVVGPALMCQALVENVARSERKLMVTITSGMGSIADSSGGHYVYRSTKAAVNMVMHSLALELKARGIGVFVINPGWVKTDMGGARAPLSPQASIAAMRGVFDGVTLEDTGAFLNYDGGRYPW
jgi:NAD(P)-dependent dehydrogenase (short-subunit alcohol dehydrogenase family)